MKVKGTTLLLLCPNKRGRRSRSQTTAPLCHARRIFINPDTWQFLCHSLCSWLWEKRGEKKLLKSLNHFSWNQCPVGHSNSLQPPGRCFPTALLRIQLLLLALLPGLLSLYWGASPVTGIPSSIFTAETNAHPRNFTPKGPPQKTAHTTIWTSAQYSLKYSL